MSFLIERYPFFIAIYPLSFGCINNNMATIINENQRLQTMSENIVMAIDDNNIGELYVYTPSNNFGYVLNGMTASYLVDYFAMTDNADISEEVIDVVMSITTNQTTQ